MKEFLNFYFSFYGTIKRKEFWLYYFLPLFIFFAGKYALVTNEGMVVTLSPLQDTVITLLIIYVALAVTVKRLRDAQFSFWWMLIILLPLLGSLILTGICGFAPSKARVSEERNPLEWQEIEADKENK